MFIVHEHKVNPEKYCGRWGGTNKSLIPSELCHDLHIYVRTTYCGSLSQHNLSQNTWLSQSSSAPVNVQ